MPSLRKFALVAAGLAVAATFAADTAPVAQSAPVTVQIRYDVKSTWNVPAAVKAANVGPVKLVKTNAANLGNCNSNCVLIFSDPLVSHTDCNGFSPASNTAIRAAERRPVVACRMGSVQLGDTVTKSWTAAQRHNALVAGIKVAVRR